MIIATRVLTSLLALIALATGALGLVNGLGDAAVEPILDNNYRFFAGVWFVVGIGLVHTVIDIKGSTKLHRLLMIAIAVGGIGRAIGMLDYAPERRMIIGTLIETILPVLLIWMGAKVAKR